MSPLYALCERHVNRDTANKGCARNALSIAPGGGQKPVENAPAICYHGHMEKVPSRAPRRRSALTETTNGGIQYDSKVLLWHGV